VDPLTEPDTPCVSVCELVLVGEPLDVLERKSDPEYEGDFDCEVE